MRKLSNAVATKEYVPNTLGNCFTFNNFFAWEQFYIDFPLFFSILNTKSKYVLFAMTATGSLNVKSLFENASSRIVTFL